MDGCFSSSLERTFCHAITSCVSPTDFPCQYYLSYRGRKLPVLDHSALLIESMDNQLNLLLGWVGGVVDEEGDKLLS